MSDFQPVIITAVVSLGIVAWALLWAFIIGLVIELRRPKTDDNSTDETADDTLSSVDCPMHGANCEGWL